MTETKQTPPQNASNDWISIPAAEMATRDLPPLIEVVEGVVTENAKLLIGGAAKTYKTWIGMDLALSVACGATFLGRATHQTSVLYVNLELKEDTFIRRIREIASAKGIALGQWPLQQISLRGKLCTGGIHLQVCSIIDRIIRMAKANHCGLVLCDPLYKLNLEGDENSSRDQTRLFNQLDRITIEVPATLVLIDHFSKGNQSQKDPLDAIRGSSAKGGDVDAAFIVRRHEVEACYAVDIVHRELPPVSPFCLEWKAPLMRVRQDLKSKDRAGNQSSAAKTKATKLKKFLSLLPIEGLEPSPWVKKSERFGISRSTGFKYIAELVENNSIFFLEDENRWCPTARGDVFAKYRRRVSPVDFSYNGSIDD